MKKLNVKYNSIIFDDKQKHKIVELYVQQGLSTVDIGAYFGCSHKRISKELESMGIARTHTSRKYGLDEHYFDVLDAQNKAYILGFLYADGQNCLKKDTIQLSLQEEDKDILEKIRKELRSEKPLDYLDYSGKNDFGYNYKNQYRLILFSHFLCTRLYEIGMVPNKSLILEFPDIPSSLYSHFIRGYFDGDGCLSVNIDKKYARFSITQTESFCNRVKEIFTNELGVSAGGVYDSSCHNGITRVLSIGGLNQLEKIMDWLYLDSNMFLQRKYEKYLTMKKMIKIPLV